MMIHTRNLACFALLASVLAACGGGATSGCPSPQSPASSRAEWEKQLDARTEKFVQTDSPIPLKRDVHKIVIGANADQVATAFHQVMRDPNRHFGLIEVDRKAADVGKPFVIGSRFQGRYRLEDALPVLKSLEGSAEIRAAVCQLENEDTSDYGIIAVLQLPPEVPAADCAAAPCPAPTPPPANTTYVLEYHYLSGSPIAGSSRFEVRQMVPGMSELTQIFSYQENDAAFAEFFKVSGLNLHNQVVYSQAQQTAELLKVRLVSSDIPPPSK